MGLEQSNGKVNPLGTEKIGKLIMKYSIPAVVSGVVSAIYNLVDQIFLGWGVGELGMAATNVAFPLSTICMALASLFGVGAASRISLMLGKGENEKANKVAGNSITLMALGSIAVMIITFAFLQPLLRAFGVVASIMPYAVPYTVITAVGFPFLIFSFGASMIIRTDGSPNFAMGITMSGAIFNLIFDPIFLFVFDMGIEGIALATTLGQILSSILAIYYFVRKKKSIVLKLSHFRLQGESIKAICSLGLAGGITQLSMMLTQIVTNNVLIYYGELSSYGSTIPLAVVGAVSKLNMLFMVVIMGVAQGCQPIVGYNYGAKNYSRVKSAYKTGLIFVTLYSIAGWACFQLFPAQIMSIFGTGNEIYYDFATRYIRIFMMLLFVVGAQAFTSNFFTSIGKSVLGALMSLIRQVVVLTPLLIVLPMFLGMDGILYSGPLADGIAIVLTGIFALHEWRLLSNKEVKSLSDKSAVLVRKKNTPM